MPTKINAGRREKELRGKSRRSLTKSTDEFSSANLCSKPKFVVNSSQIAIADGREDSEDESNGNVENVVLNLPSNSSNNNNNNKATKFPEPNKDSRVTSTGEPSKMKTSIAEGPDNGHTQRDIGACAANKVQWVYFCKYTSKIDGIIF